MADINFMVADENVEGSHKEDGGSSDDPDEENWMEVEEFLSPLVRLEKYALSKKTYTRQMVGRVLLQVIRESASEAIVPDLPALMNLVELTAADKETMVRTELVEAIPHLALVCIDSNDPAIKDVVSKHLLSVVVDCLVDKEAQVRKISLAALLVLMEHGLVDRTDIEKKVCPSVLELSYGRVDEEFLTGTIAFMSKLAPLLGKETTEQLFLKRFSELCTNVCFNVRKVCAASIGEFCAVVGHEAVEQIILPRFVQLCDDQVWNVRKACAEIVISLSCACTPQLRYSVLAPAFTKLLEDVSKCVRLAAYQILGPFISTFASPRVIGLAYSETGELVMINRDGIEFRLSSPALTCTNIRSQLLSHQHLDQLQKKNEAPNINPELTLNSSITPTPNIVLSSNVESENMEVEDAEQPSENNKCLKETNVEETSEEKSEPIFSDVTDFQSSEDLTAGGDDYFVISPVAQTECSDINCDNNEGDFKSENSKTSDSSELTPPSPPQPSVTTTSDTDSNVNVDATKPKKRYNRKNRNYRGNGKKGNQQQQSQQQQPIQEETTPMDVTPTNAQNITEINSNINTELKVVTKDISNLNLNADNSPTVNNNNETNQNCNEAPESSCKTNEKLNNLNENSIEIYTENDNKANPTVIPLKNFCNSDENSVIKHHFTTYCNDINVNNPTPEDELIDKDIEKFNLYQYWYISPELPLDMNIVEAGKSPQSQKENCDSQKVTIPRKKLFSEVLMDGETDDVCATKVPLSSYISALSSIDDGSIDIQPIDYFRNFDSNTKEIVPRLLINHYLSMADPEVVNLNDSELSYHCAFSFPAVALTLGRDYWPVLCQTYRDLAADMRWRVRRTVAGSLHELAAILGEKLATEHLIPVFDGISRDVDEVRIGILKHVVDFIKLVNPRKRIYCLSRLIDYLSPDSEVNWRFRCESAEQLLLSIPLWSLRNITICIVPLSINLLKDKVAAVRSTSILLMSEVIQNLQPDPVSSSRLLADLAEQFAHSTRWVRRQTFAALCAKLTSYYVLTPEIFARDMLTHLLDLSWDPVANVRLTVARTISNGIIASNYFPAHTTHYQETSIVLRRLQTDKDRDVRQVAGA